MAWKWFDIQNYRASVGGPPTYYGIVQLYGTEFYAALRFYRENPGWDASAPTTYGQRFYAYMDFQQMPVMVDLLRNEGPLRFGFDDADPNRFHLMTGTEPVGEGDGLPAD